MRLLLDTHALLWWLGDDPRLGEDARIAIAQMDNMVFVSAASAWEIAIKKRSGKLRAPDDLEKQIARHNFTPLPISIRHALLAGGLPPAHQDPFDRMLVAQAMDEGLFIITRDEHIPAYGVEVLRA